MKGPVLFLGRTFLIAALLVALGILVPGDARAQAQTKDEQKCTNAMNKDLQKIAATEGKDINACDDRGVLRLAAAQLRSLAGA